MISRFIALFFLFQAIFIQVSAQSKPVFESSNKECIQEVSVTDSNFKKHLIDYINEQSKTDSFFSKHGYLVLRLKKQDNSIACFMLNKSYYYYSANEIESLPNCYSKISGRLILIYTNTYRLIHSPKKLKSAKKLIKLINESMPKENDVIAEDTATHRKIKLRPEGKIILEGSAIEICQTL